MEEKIGKIRTYITEITITDINISRIIKESLKEKGFDLEVILIKDNNNYVTSEKIKIYAVE